MRAWYRAFAFSIVSLDALVGSSAIAGSYNDCVINNLKSVTVNQAVYALKEACLSKSSSPLPSDLLPLLKGTLGIGTPPFGSQNALYVRVRNETPYTITSLDLQVQSGADYHNYHIRRFYPVPAPGILDGPPTDVSLQEKIAPLSTIYFYSEADEPLSSAVNWRFTGASGFVGD